MAGRVEGLSATVLFMRERSKTARAAHACCWQHSDKQHTILVSNHASTLCTGQGHPCIVWGREEQC
jgi:hypothetical protein